MRKTAVYPMFVSFEELSLFRFMVYNPAISPNIDSVPHS